jgi:hypothetical protein
MSLARFSGFDTVTEKPLKCFCRSKPLLATYGVDSSGKLFVRVKVYKQARIYAEVVFQGGVVQICCRNCFRWHRVIFKEHAAALSEEQPLEIVSNDG